MIQALAKLDLWQLGGGNFAPHRENTGTKKSGWNKVKTIKTSQNILFLDKVFVVQNFSLDRIFDTSEKFRHFCPTFFCPIR